jgi:glycosyltransferase involved in cell wall biosynthesis
MTSYKGVDWLVDAVNHVRRFKEGKKVRLILAGGRAPSQEGKAHYERFYTQLAQKVAKSTSLVLTGFIPDDELPHYFAAGDLVVLPYRGILGASASWAQAMAFEKPFILSEDLMPYLKGEDIQEALQKVGLDQKDLIFKRSKRAFAKKIFSLLNENKLSNLAQISSRVAQARSPKVRLMLEEELYTPQKAGYSVQLERAILFAKKTYSGLMA